MTKVDGLLGDSTVFFWAGCHSWYQSDYMYQSLINNLNHCFCIKLAKIVWICKVRWFVKDKLDRETLKGILGSFRWLINLWFILLTSSTLLYVRLTFLHNQTSGATCFIRVLCRIMGIARVDGVIHSTDLIFLSGHELCCRHVFYTCAFPTLCLITLLTYYTNVGMFWGSGLSYEFLFTTARTLCNYICLLVSSFNIRLYLATYDYPIS
jgi:hypothetical protein